METRANYIAIGLFTIVGFLGLLGFLAWFTNTELNRQFAYYEARFDNVSGLNQAATVRFAGLVVGQVVDLRLSENGAGTVTVRLEVAADTPVRADSVATIESQGVTGVSFIGITAGSPDAPLLADVSPLDVPEITSGQSLFESLTQGVPELLDETLTLIQDVRNLFGPENQARFENILVNLDESSANLTQTLDQFANVANSVGTSVNDIASFTEGLAGISASVEGTLQVADDALAAIRSLSARAETTLDSSTAALDGATRTFDSAQVFIDGELTTALADITETSSVLRTETQTLAAEAETLLINWSDTGQTATARLTQAEEILNNADSLIARLDTTLASIDETALSITAFIETDASTALAQATDVMATLQNDLPSILSDVRSATATANTTFTTLSEDVTSASGRLDGVLEGAETTLATVADTFERANTTLGAIEEALANSEATLDAAAGAFRGADQFINEDLIGISDELRTAVESFNRTLDAVADDIPAATADLRATTEVARTTFTDLQRIVASGEAPVNSFLTEGLPQFSRLAIEGQRLLSTLEQLTRRIERDPARFLLGQEAPEFRR
jgi:phospholipid/cholesterol/gamma-HCH transport system substrate-binding protein